MIGGPRLCEPAYVPGLPGVVSAGGTFEECAANIQEAIELYEANLETTAPAIPGSSSGSASELTKKAG